MLTTQPMLSDREWSLVMQLLEAEQHELPVEMRHTDSRSYSDALDERRTMIEDLVQRLRSQGVVS
jgi:hypothetical protein